MNTFVCEGDVGMDFGEKSRTRERGSDIDIGILIFLWREDFKELKSLK